MSISLLVVDDHEVAREGITVILRDEPDLKIVGQASRPSEAVKMARDLQPNVVLMDVFIPEEEGIDAVKSIREHYPDLSVVIFSMSDNPTNVARAVAAGATDYVLKADPVDSMINAIRRAAVRESPPAGCLFNTVLNILRDDSPSHLCPQLTRREVQVLRHLALGLSNRDICRSMCISLETTKEHVQNVLRKTNAVDRTQAAVWAARAGLAG